MATPLAKPAPRPDFPAMNAPPEATPFPNPVRLEADERHVHAGFLNKARRTLGRIPFTEDALAAYFCAIDPATPLSARATLFGALAYFVLPIDIVPDFILGVGYADDAAVILTAIKTAQAHIAEPHRNRARAWLRKERPPAG